MLSHYLSVYLRKNNYKIFQSWAFQEKELSESKTIALSDIFGSEEKFHGNITSKVFFPIWFF